MTHNLVERDFAFTPYSLTAGTVSKIDLSTNRVGGELALSLPVAEAPWVLAKSEAHVPKHLSWSGLIPLKNLVVDGTLVVGFADQSKGGRMTVDTEGILSEKKMLCGARDDWPARVHLDLANTTAKSIQWAAPLRRPEGSPADCVSWEGVGLRYDNWEAGSGWSDRPEKNDDEGSVRSSEQFPELLRQWRALYVRTASEPRAGEPPPDPLHHMADQLAKIGEQKESRQVRAEAKRAGFPLSTDDFLTSLGNGVARIVFFPTDFGTKPERAFIVLAVVTLAAWVVYTWLAWHYRESWWQFERARDMLEKRDRIREAMRQHLANRTLDRNGDDLDAAEYRLTEVLDRHAPKPTESDSTSSDASGVAHGQPESRQSTLEPGLSEAELRHISAVPGFMQYDRNRQPQYFNLVRYAVDTMIPVIDLHAYNQYYPMRGWVLNFTMLQHVVGWWVLTSFLASIAVF